MLYGFPGLVFQLAHAVGRPRDGIRYRFADHGIAHDSRHAFIRGQFLPAHVSDRPADGGGLHGLPCAPQGLRGVQHRMARALTGSRYRLVALFRGRDYGLFTGFQYRIPSHIFVF